MTAAGIVAVFALTHGPMDLPSTVQPLPVMTANSVVTVAGSGDCVIDSAMQDEMPTCWREWLNAGRKGLQSSLTMGGAVIAIESCGIAMGLTCVGALWGITESYEAFDEFMAALLELQECLRENEPA